MFVYILDEQGQYQRGFDNHIKSESSRGFRAELWMSPASMTLRGIDLVIQPGRMHDFMGNALLKIFIGP